MAAEEDLNWDDLRYFRRAAQARTLAGAARAMRVEHTTVGRRLSALERSLGVALVIRRPDGLLLTPLGEKVAALVEEVNRAVTAVNELVAEQRARVRIAIPSGVGQLLTPHLPSLQREHPGLSLELLSGSRPVDLSRGEADLAVRVGPCADRDLVAKKIGDVGSSLYASDAYLARHPGPVDPDDLGGHELVGYDPRYAALPAARWLEERKGATIVLRCREMTELISAAASGVGIALVACWLADREPALRRLTDRVIARRTMTIVYRREARLSQPVREAIRFVTRVLGEQMTILGG